MQDDSIFTRTVHAGENPKAHHGAISTPVFNASIFVFETAESGAAIHNYEQPGYFYSRLGNPTTDALQRALCELEGGESCLAFASGMAAISAAIFSLVKSGDHIVAPESLYVTTNNLLDNLQEQFGVAVTYVDATDAREYADAIRPNTKVLYLETPANPTLKISDIAAIAQIAKQQNIKTVLDNTFATPFNQQPLLLGIDAVVHSATKYLGGHSDLTAGAVVASKEIIERIEFHAAKLFGGNIAPQVAWLVLRGIKTLALRMERHNANAFAVANMLAANSKVKTVYYPGLESHPQYEIAKKQMRGFGGMIAFDVGSVEAGRALMNNLKLCTLATSLGGVETLIQHSASMTNAKTPPEDRLKAGITDGLIRLSVGIESAADIVADLKSGLNKI